MSGLVAHALRARADLPLPEWLFVWGAAVILIVSFLALAILWPKPKLEGDGWRALPGGVGRALASAPVQVACGAIGVALLVLTIWSGLVGEPNPNANWAPTFIFVTFWLGLVPLSVLFGDVFRAFNPWRAIAKAVAWLGAKLMRGPLPSALPYPERLGRWPAAVGIFAFVALELEVGIIQTWLGIGAQADIPQKIAIAALLYTALTFVAMALYGVDRWIERGEAFSVYFNLFARISPFETRDGEVGVRRPLSGLAHLEPLPGTVPLLAVIIGTVTFDGATEGPLWRDNGIADDLIDLFEAIGVPGGLHAEEAATLVGMLATVLIIGGFYMLGAAGARWMAGGESVKGLAGSFVHSLVPIALVYTAAHYFTFLITRGQETPALLSDPLGEGDDWFGTADWAADYGIVGAETTWYVQVAFVVVGHVAALMLAHDRALVLYDKPTRATRSQYWMLGVMVGFTCLALWLLSQANQ